MGGAGRCKKNGRRREDGQGVCFELWKEEQSVEEDVGTHGSLRRSLVEGRAGMERRREGRWEGRRKGWGGGWMKLPDERARCCGDESKMLLAR